MNSNGRIIEFYKTGKNNLILTEIRPVQCLINSSRGMVKSTKWMTADHWLELESMVDSIFGNYEKTQKRCTSKKLKLEEPTIIKGMQSIEIGYSFKKNITDQSSYLVPRCDKIWSDDSSSSVSEKDGHFKTVNGCGYILLIAVAPLKLILPNKKSIDESLYSALDFTMKQRTIKSYFQKSSKLSRRKGNSKNCRDVANKCDTDICTDMEDTRFSNTSINSLESYRPQQELWVSPLDRLIPPLNLLEMEEGDDGASKQRDLFFNVEDRCVRVNSRNEVITQLDDVNYVHCNSQNHLTLSFDNSQNQLFDDDLSNQSLVELDDSNTFQNSCSTIQSLSSNASKSKSVSETKMESLFGSTETSFSEPDEEYSHHDSLISISSLGYKNSTNCYIPSNNNSETVALLNAGENPVECSLNSKQILSSPKQTEMKVSNENVWDEREFSDSEISEDHTDMLTERKLQLEREQELVKRNTKIKISDKSTEDGRKRKTVQNRRYRRPRKELEMYKKLNEVVVKLRNTKAEADLVLQRENLFDLSQISNNSAEYVSTKNKDTSVPEKVRKKHQFNLETGINKPTLPSKINCIKDPDFKVANKDFFKKRKKRSKKEIDSPITSDFESLFKSPGNKRHRKGNLSPQKTNKRSKKRSLNLDKYTLDKYLKPRRSVLITDEHEMSHQIELLEQNSSDLSANIDSTTIENAESCDELTPSKLEEMKFINKVIDYFQTLTTEECEKFFDENVKHFLKLKSGDHQTKRSKLFFKFQRKQINAEIYIMFIENSSLMILLDKWQSLFNGGYSDSVSFFYLVIMPDLIHRIFSQIPAVRKHQSFADEELEDILFNIAIEIEGRK